MNNIFQKLTEKIESVNLLVDETRKYLEASPDDFSLKLELKSLEYHLEELQIQLRHEKLIRDREVVEFRLKGLLAENGSIPLDVVADIAKHLSGSIHSLAYRLKKGFDPRSRIPKEVIRTLNLQLAGMSYGSTKLYLSATLNPNLFGYSLIEDSLEKTFHVFSSKSSQELTDSVSEIGPRSASNINRLLKTLSRNDLEADISWVDPQEKKHIWEGSTESILQIANSLDTVITNFKESIEVFCEVMMLHKKGRFEVRSLDNDITYRGHFPIDIVEKITKIRVGELAIASIEIETTTNKTTGYEKTSYTLMSLDKETNIESKK